MNVIGATHDPEHPADIVALVADEDALYTCRLSPVSGWRCQCNPDRVWTLQSPDKCGHIGAVLFGVTPQELV